MRVLEVGSGAGDVALFAAQLVRPTVSIFGVDSNPMILETARARASATGLNNVVFAVGDIPEVTLERDFDALIGRLVLLHMQEPTEKHSASWSGM